MPTIGEVFAALLSARGAPKCPTHDAKNPFDAEEHKSDDGDHTDAFDSTTAPAIVRFESSGCITAH